MQIVSLLGNFVNAIETSFASGVGWLITFCAERGGRYIKHFPNKVIKKTSVDTIPFATKKMLKHLRWPQYLACGSFSLCVRGSLIKGTLMKKLSYCASVMSCESLKQHSSVTHQEGKWQKRLLSSVFSSGDTYCLVHASFSWQLSRRKRLYLPLKPPALKFSWIISLRFAHSNWVLPLVSCQSSFL